MSTIIFNQSYPNIGAVKITFDDSSYQTRVINSIGYTSFDSGTLHPVQIEMLGGVYYASILPQPLTYPDNSTGGISGAGLQTSDTVIYFDQQMPTKP